jgi:hypothetical protein
VEVGDAVVVVLYVRDRVVVTGSGEVADIEVDSDVPAEGHDFRVAFERGELLGVVRVAIAVAAPKKLLFVRECRNPFCDRDSGT